VLLFSDTAARIIEDGHRDKEDRGGPRFEETMHIGRLGVPTQRIGEGFQE
jgi:hypothetical protein